MIARGMEPCFYVYILADRERGRLYVGVCNDVRRRVWEHKSQVVPGHTARYQIDRLVHVEIYPTIDEARVREARLKRWRRAWKIALIEAHNLEWRDLYEELNG